MPIREATPQFNSREKEAQPKQVCSVLRIKTKEGYLCKKIPSRPKSPSEPQVFSGHIVKPIETLSSLQPNAPIEDCAEALIHAEFATLSEEERGGLKPVFARRVETNQLNQASGQQEPMETNVFEVELSGDSLKTLLKTDQYTVVSLADLLLSDRQPGVNFADRELILHPDCKTTLMEQIEITGKESLVDLRNMGETLVRISEAVAEKYDKLIGKKPDILTLKDIDKISKLISPERAEHLKKVFVRDRLIGMLLGEVGNQFAKGLSLESSFKNIFVLVTLLGAGAGDWTSEKLPALLVKDSFQDVLHGALQELGDLYSLIESGVAGTENESTFALELSNSLGLSSQTRLMPGLVSSLTPAAIFAANGHPWIGGMNIGLGVLADALGAKYSKTVAELGQKFFTDKSVAQRIINIFGSIFSTVGIRHAGNFLATIPALSQFQLVINLATLFSQEVAGHIEDAPEKVTGMKDLEKLRATIDWLEHNSYELGPQAHFDAYCETMRATPVNTRMRKVQPATTPGGLFNISPSPFLHVPNDVLVRNELKIKAESTKDWAENDSTTSPDLIRAAFPDQPNADTERQRVTCMSIDRAEQAFWPVEYNQPVVEGVLYRAIKETHSSDLTPTEIVTKAGTFMKLNINFLAESLEESSIIRKYMDTLKKGNKTISDQRAFRIAFMVMPDQELRNYLHEAVTQAIKATEKAKKATEGVKPALLIVGMDSGYKQKELVHDFNLFGKAGQLIEIGGDRIGGTVLETIAQLRRATQEAVYIREATGDTDVLREHDQSKIKYYNCDKTDSKQSAFFFVNVAPKATLDAIEKSQLFTTQEKKRFQKQVDATGSIRSIGRSSSARLTVVEAFMTDEPVIVLDNWYKNLKDPLLSQTAEFIAEQAKNRVVIIRKPPTISTPESELTEMEPERYQYQKDFDRKGILQSLRLDLDGRVTEDKPSTDKILGQLNRLDLPITRGWSENFKRRFCNEIRRELSTFDIVDGEPIRRVETFRAVVQFRVPNPDGGKADLYQLDLVSKVEEDEEGVLRESTRDSGKFSMYRSVLNKDPKATFLKIFQDAKLLSSEADLEEPLQFEKSLQKNKSQTYGILTESTCWDTTVTMPLPKAYQDVTQPIILQHQSGGYSKYVLRKIN